MEIDSSLFVRKDAPNEENIVEEKHSSQFKDAIRRFKKNKASVAGFVILVLLFLYAVITPIASPFAHIDETSFKVDAKRFSNVQPKSHLFQGTGFYDGTIRKTVGEADYLCYLGYDTADKPIIEDFGSYFDMDTATDRHDIRFDTYAIGADYINLTEEEYLNLVNYENEKGLEIILPRIDYKDYLIEYANELGDTPNKDQIISNLRNCYTTKGNYNFKAKIYTPTANNVFVPVLDNNGQIQRLSSTGERYEKSNDQYRVRVDYPAYFEYKYGFKPVFLFGSNEDGFDVFYRLAKGLLFSLGLGICVSVINFIIGLIYGAIEGYYGGKTDLIMQRITEVLAGLPSMVLLILFNILFTKLNGMPTSIGVVLGLFLAFIMTGWIGVSGTARMQFYRYKNREFVLSSRSLGAKDGRIIFHHILPNAIGTLITNSVLMIPGVIFSESTLSYLGVISFSSSGLSSVGVLLGEGNATLGTAQAYLLLFPSIVVALLMISFHLFGNGLRSAFTVQESEGGNI